MPNSLPDKKNYVLISDAASLLGVSIDTVRRWDSEGKVHSVRLNGKNRYFSIDELTYFNNTRPLTVAEVAQRLNLSVVSIRRFENEGLITAQRNSRGERVFEPAEIDRFIKERELKKISRKDIQVPLKVEKVQEELTSTAAAVNTVPSQTLYQTPTPSFREERIPYVPQINRVDQIKSSNLESFKSELNRTKLQFVPEQYKGTVDSIQRIMHESTVNSMGDDLGFDVDTDDLEYGSSSSWKIKVFAPLFILLIIFSLGYTLFESYKTQKESSAIVAGIQTGQVQKGRAVLAEKTTKKGSNITFNIDAVFEKKTTFNQLALFNDEINVKGLSIFEDDVILTDTNLDAGNGSVFA